MIFVTMFQPQNSMPDVIIWMISGTKRIAYYRMPAYDVLYEPYSEACGENCGKVQNLFMKVCTSLIHPSYSFPYQRSCSILSIHAFIHPLSTYSSTHPPTHPPTHPSIQLSCFLPFRSSIYALMNSFHAAFNFL